MTAPPADSRLASPSPASVDTDNGTETSPEATRTKAEKPKLTKIPAAPRVEPEERPAQPMASLTPAERERKLISSLFEPSKSRVLARVPSVMEENLPPEGNRAAATATEPPMLDTRGAAPPMPTARLTTPAEVARLVEGLDPYESRLHAAQALFRLWGRNFQPFKEANAPEFLDFYKMAVDQGMRCSESWVNLETLRKINLPGILEVFSPNAPSSRYIVLAAIHDDGTGTILWDTNASARVTLSALDECWRRRTFFFWQEHAPMGEIVRDGDRGEQVLWIQRSLQALGYYTAEPSGLYDPETRRAVLAFQRAFRLTPDGIVGPRTRMVMYSRLPRYATPNLAALKREPHEHHPQGAQEAAS